MAAAHIIAKLSGPNPCQWMINSLALSWHGKNTAGHNKGGRGEGEQKEPGIIRLMAARATKST